ncbi:MAG: alpha/beta fold hydrolase [Planctomycetes bacterium]|nr:alpha/beta fold hydrolase [Planctomycetota bacterium]MCB9920283.1 alpha/beta fold hydrolase [Planctomycetota bacterium]
MKALLRSDRGPVSDPDSRPSHRDGTAVVYVPGIDGTGNLLLGTQERLEGRFRLVCLRYEAEDSPDDRARDSYEALAGDIMRILDERGIDDAVLVAESFGGAVALTCALDHPSRVCAVAIVNSFAWYPKRASLALGRVFAPLVTRSMFDWFRPRFAPWSLFGQPRDDEALRRFRAIEGGFFDRAYRRRLAMIRGLDLRPRLRELRMPVALFAATRDRVVPSMQCARTMQEHIPHATLEVVEGGGHLILPLSPLPWPEWIAALAQSHPEDDTRA